MPKVTEYSNSLLNHIFNNIPMANIGDAAGLPAGTGGNLYLSLHTADPSVTGDQSSFEIVYTGYARIAVPRDSAAPKWDVANRRASNNLALTWGACTGGGGTVAMVGIGTDAAGPGHLLHRVMIQVPIMGLVVAAGVTPNIGINNLVVLEL